ncbi:MAG: DMT family transporter [Ruminococcus sp.]|nr:DMT family transporter [Ruminococcus sp.]MBQ1309689.1 DMT family transporter [Ruminococcus sp.]MBQ1381586.1 DMT family transporter [Ruminococcus sp.]MBQ2568894.1 DMT family transporter [Ruminococcus sp.]MBQ3988349.1 DMT family transporter [Ruminococcus sp.]
MTKTNHFRNVFYLALTALIWGVAFVFQSMGNDHMGAFSFTSVRYLLGGLVLVPIVLLKARYPRFLADSGEIHVKQVPVRLTVIGGILCGLALGGATVLQQLGMKTTTVGKAGFITALYIILTPIFGLFLGRKCHFTVWIGAAAAVFGMYLLCITDSFSLSAGDLLVLLCAIVFTFHIMIIDYFSPRTNGVLLSCLQFFVASAATGIPALIFEHPTLVQLSDCLIPVLYMGIMSSGVAYTLQILGQRGFNPSIAALIMSMESVVSAVAGAAAYSLGFLTQDQSMTMLQVLGCVIMFAAVIFVQLPFDKLKRRH